MSARVNNRISKTVQAVRMEMGDNLNDVVLEQNSRTLERKSIRGRRSCCRNFCAMWNYKKIVTQEEQYEWSMREVERLRALQNRSNFSMPAIFQQSNNVSKASIWRGTSMKSGGLLPPTGAKGEAYRAGLKRSYESMAMAQADADRF